MPFKNADTFHCCESTVVSSSLVLKVLLTNHVIHPKPVIASEVHAVRYILLKNQ